MKTTTEEVKLIIHNFMIDNGFDYCEFKMSLNAKKDNVIGSVFTQDEMPLIDEDDDILDKLLGDD